MVLWQDVLKVQESRREEALFRVYLYVDACGAPRTVVVELVAAVVLGPPLV
jgi:hypothetical protein